MIGLMERPSAPQFVIEDMPEGRTLVVTGAWTSDAERVVETGEVDRLWLNYARGYMQPDLSFLDAWPVRGLTLNDRSVTDLQPLERLSGTLEDISVQAAAEASLDLGAFPRLVRLAAMWEAVRDSISQASVLGNLVALYYDERDLWPLSDNRRLSRLVLKPCTRLEALAGLPVLDELEQLAIIDARRLGDISELASLRRLRELTLESCRSISTVDALAALTSLRFLSVSNCGDIETIAPLADLQGLERFSAWGSTRVLDGDLRPLLALPHLAEIRMRDRASYEPRVRSLAAAVF
jgi:hypothetical protein